jgi:hypothetical protein
MQAAEVEVSNAFSSIFPDFVAAVPVRYHTVVGRCSLTPSNPR